MISSRHRDTVLPLPIGQLATWHLAAVCGACRQDRVVSIRSLLEHYGPDVTLLRLVPRLRCGLPQCRQPPTRLTLRNRFPVQPGPSLVEVVLVDARKVSAWVWSHCNFRIIYARVSCPAYVCQRGSYDSAGL